MAMRVPDWSDLHDAVFARAAIPRLRIAIGWRGAWRCRAAADDNDSRLALRLSEVVIEHKKGKQRAEDVAGRCRTLRDGV